MFGYDDISFGVGVFSNGTLYVPGGIDDTALNDTRPDTPQYFEGLTQWKLCYQYTTFQPYYFYSIAWVIGVEPAQNPSCQPVELTAVLTG